MADTDKKPARILPLGANALRSAPHERAHFFAVVPSETTFDQVMTPGFWGNHVPALSGGATRRPWALVEVVREDGTMDLLLRVIQVKPGMVIMRAIFKYVSDENIGKPAKGAPQPGDDDLVFPDGYKGAHVPRGEVTGWMVRLPNGEVLVKGQPSKKAAVEYAKKHAAEALAPVT